MIVALLILLQATGGNPAHVDQLPTAGPTAPTVVPKLPSGPDKPSQAATIAQLPGTLEPVTAEHEDRLVPAPPAAGANRASVEVARAIGVIRGRGQVPTPELIAREVGPEVLDSYLSQLNAAAAAGVTTAADPAGGAGKAPPGTTIISPPGQ